MDDLNKVIMVAITVSIILLLIPLIISKVKESRPDENHCLEEEKYYYRKYRWFLTTGRIITTKENADGFDYRCIKWEDEPSFGAILTGQKLIYNKGELNQR